MSTETYEQRLELPLLLHRVIHVRGSNESTTSPSSFSPSALDILPVAGWDCRSVDGDSSTMNSLRNLAVASTSGVAPHSETLMLRRFSAASE